MLKCALVNNCWLGEAILLNSATPPAPPQPSMPADMLTQYDSAMTHNRHLDIRTQELEGDVATLGR